MQDTQPRDYLGRYSKYKCTNTHDRCYETLECIWCEVTNKSLKELDEKSF